MTRSIPRTAAAGLLLISGSIVGLSAFGIYVARAVIATGQFVVTPADSALLADLVAVAPVIGVFGLLNVVAGFAILVDAAHARAAATTVAAAGVVLGTIGLALLLLGRDPFAKVASDRALDGIEMAAVFTAWYLATLIALVVGRVKGPRRISTAAA